MDRQRDVVRTLHLCVHDHVQEFEATQNEVRAVQIREPDYWSASASDRLMILLHNVVQVSGL